MHANLNMDSAKRVGHISQRLDEFSQFHFFEQIINSFATAAPIIH
ncbi:hypothetical protein CLU81_4939 [Flavobacterium sp. 9]|nr:hypothetical protein CLU81_4939 [Flavobacterium sp. 9]